MKVNLLAVVVGSLMAVSALADTANVNVYGTLNTSFYRASASNPDSPTFFRVACNSCNFGLKGDETLVEGLKLVWQFENGVNITNGGGSTLAGRNSGIGFSGGWGTFMVGNWDTPYKSIHNALEPTWATGPGYMVGILDTPGLGATSTTFTTIVGTGSANPVSFSRRQATSLRYVSPKLFDAATFTFMYANSPAATNQNLLSAGLSFAQGMFLAGAAYEAHKDARTAATFGTAHGIATSNLATPTQGSHDTGVKLMAGVKPIDGLLVGGVFTSNKYRNKIAGGEDTYSKSAFLASAQYSVNSFNFALGFGSAGTGSCARSGGAECTVTDNGASQLVGKFGYSYSKRTDVYISYSKLTNKQNGTYNFPLSDDQFTTVTKQTADGTSLGALSVGFRHTF